MKKVLSNREEKDKCIPWFFPLVDPDVRLCSPFEARSFKKDIDSVAADDCRVIYNHICIIQMYLISNS